MQKRIQWVDVAKAVGIFAIVLGHTVDEGLCKQYVYSFHIPLFMFLSGATFHVHGKPFAAFMKERARRLLIPYAVFALISQSVYLLMRRIAGGAMETARSFTDAQGWLGILWGNVDANRALWFLPCLFLMSMMLYPVVKQLEENPARGRRIALAVIAASVGYTALDAVMGIGNLPWKLDAAGKLIGFALGGWFFLNGCETASLRGAGVRAGALALLVIGGAAGLMWNERIRYLGSEYGNVAVFYLSSVCSVLGVCLLLTGTQGCRPLEYVGRCTLAILTMHKFPVLFFEWLCPGVKGWMAGGVLPVQIGVVLVSIGLCCAAERIVLKACPLMLGRSAAR